MEKDLPIISLFYIIKNNHQMILKAILTGIWRTLTFSSELYAIEDVIRSDKPPNEEQPPN